MDQTTNDILTVARVDNPREVIPRTHYASEIGASTKFVDVLPNRLHLRRDYTAGRFKGAGKIGTLFHEVSLVPLYLLDDPLTFNVLAPYANPHILQQFPVSYKATDALEVVEESREQFLARMHDVLKDVVYESWNPEMDHVVLHSSGLDSRILSWVIRELYEEYGDSWLGNVLFACSKWERQEFNKIMACEGWAQDQYCVPSEILDENEYYFWSLLDFDNAWERANGVSAMPVNLFWYLVDWAQHNGILSNAVQAFNGHLGNTVLDSSSAKKLCKMRRKLYYSVMCMRPMKGDEAYLPFADVSVVRTIMQSSVKLGRKLRPRLLEYMNPELIQFDNMHADGDRRRPISQRIMARVLKDYKKSWYGTYVHPEAEPSHATTEFQPFWSHWTAASLCNHLLRSGYEIEVAQ